MKTYIKFLSTNYLKALFNVFLIMFSLIFILNLLTELEFFKELNVKSYYPLYLSLLNTPSFLMEMFPFIILLATQLFFNDLFDNNQIDIFKYSGFKNSKIIFLINILVFLIGILIISFFYSFSSSFKKLYLELKSNYTNDNKYLAVVTQNGLWIKDQINENILIISSSRIEQNFLIDSYISEFDKNFKIIRNIKSKKIDITNNNWKIYNAEVFNENNKEIKEMIKLDTNFNYKIIQKLFSNLSSLSFLELIELRSNYKKLNYSLVDIDLQLLKLLTYPLYLLLMTTFSSIIMLYNKDSHNKYLKIVLGLFASVNIYYLSNFFYVLGATERIDLIWSISIPLVILFLINSYFYIKINAK